MSERSDKERLDWLDVALLNGWAVKGAVQCYGTCGEIQLTDPYGVEQKPQSELSDAIDAAIDAEENPDA